VIYSNLKIWFSPYWNQSYCP